MSSEKFTRLIDSLPLPLIEDGKLLKACMKKKRVDESEILLQARQLQGLERPDQIKYAILEMGLGNTGVPKEPARKS